MFRQHWPALLLLAVPVILGLIAFHPTFRYGFAQDDWVRLEKARQPLVSILGEWLGPGTQGRRPVEQLYFWAALQLFGPSSHAFHALAAVIHGLNIVLVQVLFRRLTHPGIAVLGATFCAVHVVAFTVLYWTSCAPELLTALCSLAMILAALAPPGEGGNPAAPPGGWRGWRWPAVLYLAALGAKETALLLPFALLGLGPAAGLSPAVTRRRAFAVLLAGAAYALFYATIKEGIAKPAYRSDFSVSGLTSRLGLYLVWIFDLGRPIRHINQAGALDRGVAASVFALLVLIALLSGSRARRLGLAGLAWLGAILAPAIAVTGHTYQYLIYLALPGLVLLATPALETIFKLIARLRPAAAPWAVALGTAAVAVIGIGGDIETEQIAVPARGHWNREHFVLRRAVVADRALAQMAPDMRFLPPGTAVVFVSGNRMRNWWDVNFSSALGEGAALRARFDRPGLEVRFVQRGTSLAELSGRRAIIYEYERDGSLRSLGTGKIRPGTRLE